MKKLSRIITVLIVLVLALSPLLTLANANDIHEPSSALSIIKVYAYENVLKLGDQCFIAQINIPYSTAPLLPSSSAYLGRLVSNLSVEVGSTPIVSYFNNGYGYNTFSLYFPTAVVPWNVAPVYTLSLSGSPTLNWLGNDATTLMSGAQSQGFGDQTSQANNATLNDVNLLAGVGLNTSYYFGSVSNFDKLTIKVSTPGAGVWTTVWEYWNGSGWSPLTNVVDDTTYFICPVGNHDVTFTIPDDWVASVLGSVATSQMWIRVRVNSFTSVTVAPLGAQCWVNGGTTYPNVSMPSTSFIWNTTTTILQTQNLMYAQTITWADALGAFWNIALTTFSGSTKIFSSFGQTYFPQAIPGLQQMCPSLFVTTLNAPKYVQKTTNVAAANTVTSTWPLDFSGVAHYLGFTGADTAFRGIILLVGIFFITTLVTTKSPGAGLPVAWALLIGFSAIGWITPILCAAVVFAVTIIFGLVFLLGKPIT